MDSRKWLRDNGGPTSGLGVLKGHNHHFSPFHTSFELYIASGTTETTQLDRCTKPVYQLQTAARTSGDTLIKQVLGEWYYCAAKLQIRKDLADVIHKSANALNYKETVEQVPAIANYTRMYNALQRACQPHCLDLMITIVAVVAGNNDILPI